METTFKNRGVVLVSHFNFYGRIAKENVEEIQQNGRYVVQREAEEKVPLDVAQKLDIRSTDTVLDVGCGMGLNLFYLAEKVSTVTGCDHENVIERLREKAKSFDNVSLLGGNFLDIEFQQKFTKIVIYSVFPSLPNLETVYRFIDKAVASLAYDGLILIGDIANVDKKKRFLNSKRGQVFQRMWDEKKLDTSFSEEIVKLQDANEKVVIMNDKTILDIISYVRKRGFDGYILNQEQNLPFGNTREDVLIVGSEYERKY